MIYGKHAREICSCGKPCTTEWYGVKLCLECALLAKKMADIAKRGGRVYATEDTGATRP